MTSVATFHDLSGKSVFITGGGSGIGAALTEGFLQQGANVAFVQRSMQVRFALRWKKSTEIDHFLCPAISPIYLR